MKTRQMAVALAMATSAALLVTGCSGGSGSQENAKGPDFTAKISGSMTAGGFTLGDEVATSRADYAAAQLKKDNAKVTINQGNFDAQKFAAQAASGNLPDVVLMDRQYVATYASKGLIVPLDECYSAQKVDPTEHYYSSLLDDVSYNGDVYGIPQFWQPQAILLNTRVMDAAGVTADDMDTSKPDKILAATKKMYKETDGKPSTLGFDPQLPNSANMWFLAFGGKVVDKDGKPALDDPANVKALEWLQRIYEAQGGYEKAYSFGQTWDFFGAKNQFTSDQVGAGLYAQWYPNVLADFAADTTLSGVPMRGADGKPIAAAGGSAYVIPAKAKNPAAACKWAIADTSDDAWIAAAEARLETVKKTPGKLFTGLFTGSSTADKIIKDKYLKPTGNKGFDEAINAYYEELSNPASLGSSPAGLQINTELQNAIVPAMTGKKSVKDALGDAQAAAMLAYNQAIKK
jgi:multiple sugar transport system substrate-binding protein